MRVMSLAMFYAAAGFLAFTVDCTEPQPRPKYDPQTGKPLVQSCYSIVGTYSTHIQCRDKEHVGSGIMVLHGCKILKSAMFEEYAIGDIYNAANIVTEDCR